MNSCRDINDQTSDLLAGRMTLRRRLAFYVHLLLCSHCRLFTRHMKLLINSLPRQTREAPSARFVARILAVLPDDTASWPASGAAAEHANPDPGEQPGDADHQPNGSH